MESLALHSDSKICEPLNKSSSSSPNPSRDRLTTLPHNDNQISEPLNQSSSSTPNPSRDRLTTLPFEILIKVIVELPVFEYLNIAHTSHRLRSVLKTYAATICNLRIKARYQFEADFLKSEMARGWIVPTHKALNAEERWYDRELSRQYHRHQENSHKDLKNFSLKGEVSKRLRIKVTNPGPQYLYFLDKKEFIKICDRARNEGAKEAEKDGGKTSVKDGCRCAVHHRDSLHRYRMFGKRGGIVAFSGFLQSFNNLVVTVRGGILVPRTVKGRFPRALIWYFGVENLVLKDAEWVNGY